MTLAQFVKRLMINLLNFEINMRNLNETREKPLETWMEWFLRWAEWETDMHDEYWNIEKTRREK